MSTKAIREAIEAYRKTSEPMQERHRRVLAALEEIEALERHAGLMCRVIRRAPQDIIVPELFDAGNMFAAIARQNEEAK